MYRDSNTGRGSVASRGSKHDSKHDISQLGNVRSSEDIRRVSIEFPQPLTTNAASVDRVRILYSVYISYIMYLKGIYYCRHCTDCSFSFSI